MTDCGLLIIKIKGDQNEKILITIQRQIRGDASAGVLQRQSNQTAGLTSTPVKTVGGVTILPDMTLDQLEPAQSAMLILPGGSTWDGGQNMEAAQKAKDFLAADTNPGTGSEQ